MRPWIGRAFRTLGWALLALLLNAQAHAELVSFDSICGQDQLFVDGTVPDLHWEKTAPVIKIPMGQTCWLRLQRPSQIADPNGRFLIIENSWGSDITIYTPTGELFAKTTVGGARYRAFVNKRWVLVPVDANSPMLLYAKVVAQSHFSTVRHSSSELDSTSVGNLQKQQLKDAAIGWLLFSAAVFSFLFFLFQRNKDYALFSGFALIFALTLFSDRGELAPFGLTASSDTLSLAYPLSGVALAWLALRVGRFSTYTPWVARAIQAVILLYGSLAAWQIATMTGLPVSALWFETAADYVYNVAALLQVLVFWASFQAWRRGDRAGVLLAVGIAPLILFEVQISDWFSEYLPQTASTVTQWLGSSLRITSYLLLPVMFFIAIAYRAEKAQRDAIRLAQRDHLTNMPNRDYFLVLGKNLLKESSEAVLLAISIERLKAINGVLGFQVGDAVVMQVGQRLAAIGEGILARVQTNQFCLLLQNQDRIPEVRQRIEAAFAQPVIVEDQTLDVALSIGTARYLGQDMAALMRDADVALGVAKANRVNWLAYEGTMNTTRPENLRLLSDLNRAIGESELRLYLQPKVRLTDGQVMGAEALVRWQHPTRGMVPPNEFIPFAEQTGKISPLTMWVIQEGARLALMLRQSARPIVISVNISTHDLREPEFVSRAIALVQAQGAETSDLRLEVTESGMMEDPQTSLTVLHALRDAGFSLSIDDFGTGYSSLSYLQKMPVAELKIDSSFVHNVHAGSEGAELLDSIIALGHRMGLSVVAEGAETEQEYALLQSLGCDNLQGWFVARAMPMAEFVQWRTLHDPFDFQKNAHPNPET